ATMLIGGQAGLALAAQQDTDARIPTFSRDVAPILFEHCASCHRPGGPAPFSVLSWDGVRERAARIAESTTEGHMPPWLPSDEGVELAGARRLAPRELTTITEWASGGAPAGDARHLPPAPPEPPRWPLGHPDLIVRAPAVSVPPGEGDVYRNLVITAPVERARYVRAVDLRPGDPRVVHHARLMIDTTGASRAADALEPAPGFDGMQATPTAQNPAGHFVGWTPGRAPHAGDPALAWPLEPGTDLVLQLHLRPSGDAHEIRPEIGIYLADAPPTARPSLVMLGTEIIDIPPGDSAHVVSDAYTLPVAVDLLSIYPHAHYLAKTMTGRARLPDGRVVPLIHSPDWDFDWQDEYRLARPMALPAGTTLEMRYTYDNSIANPQNPNVPPRRVQYGSRSTDEMADMILQVVPRNVEDGDVLDQDLSAHYERAAIDYFAWKEKELGREALIDGAPDVALEHFQASLSNRDDPRVLAMMADAMLELGDRATAVLALERALHLARSTDDRALVMDLEARL